MTNAEFQALWQDAQSAKDREVFVSDWALSSVFAGDVPESLIDSEKSNSDALRLYEDLSHLWNAANLPFRDLLAEFRLSQSDLARRFAIPLRTVQNWAAGTPCPSYLRLMMAESLQYVDLRDR